MNYKSLSTAVSVAITSIFAMACPLFSADAPVGQTEAVATSSSWGSGFASNGERIYFTATSEKGGKITTSGIRGADGKTIPGPIACVSCHSPDGKGGKQKVNVGGGEMQMMDARDIRWSVLKRDYNPETFNMAVTKGKYPDGTPLKPEMPRYKISDKDLADLILFLQKLP